MSFFNPVRPDGRILIDGGVLNPIPLNRVTRKKGDLLVGVDVSGYDYDGQRRTRLALAARRKKSLNPLKRMMPDGQGVNYISLLTRASSLMIRQNSKLMVELMKPDILLDIRMSRYSGTDYDKSEQIINAGKKTTKKTLDNLLFTLVTDL